MLWPNMAIGYGDYREAYDLLHAMVYCSTMNLHAEERHL